MADDTPLDGEFVDFDDDDADVVDTEDGGAIVRLEDSPKKGDSPFLVNLAERLDNNELQRLATEFVDLITRDKEARVKRDEKYAEGLKRTGLGDDAPGGATFEGASRVVHPVLTEVCVDFSARAIKELCPPDGPVKSKIIGDVTKERVSKANRKADFMNWQLTVQSTEFRSELEQTLTQVPLGGAQYIKLTWVTRRNRPGFLFVPIDDILLPFAATNFYSAQRKTHVQYITKLEYDKRVSSGMYRDLLLGGPSQLPESTVSATANDKIEGRDENAYNEDGLRTVFEIYAICEIEGDESTDEAAPYIISIDKSDNKVLSIYRNWDEDDDSQEELQWLVEFPFVPWRGAYPIGIIHMIGGLSAAATGALRALLDSAHIQNSATMLKLKGGSRGGQSLNMEPTEIKEIEGGINVDDIRKLAMPLPFNPPSQTLFQLLGFVVDAAKGVVRTTMDEVADSNQNVPVGTTLAKIEQGMVVFSAIHGRLHNAMGMLLRILHRLNAMYLDDVEEKEETGSVVASRADFDGPMDVVPVSDPNIFSEAQRYAQMQAVAQRVQLNPDLYNRRAAEVRILETMKVPGFSELLQPAMTPTEENAVSENVKASLGRPVVAFPGQDHVAHLSTHLAFMKSPLFGFSQLIAPAFLGLILTHIKEHIVLWYADEVFKTANDVTDQELGELIRQTKDKDDKQALDRLIAQASLDVVAAAKMALGEMPPAIGEAIAMMQKLTPPPPADPAVEVAREDVKMRGQTKMAEIEVDKAALADKAREDAQDAQVKAASEAADTERARFEAAADAQREAAGEASEDARTQAEIAARIDMNEADIAAQLLANREDNQTAMALAEMDEAAVSQDPNPQPR